MNYIWHFQPLLQQLLKIDTPLYLLVVFRGVDILSSNQQNDAVDIFTKKYQTTILTKDISPRHPEGISSWFLGLLESNKCDFIMFIGNIHKKGNISNLNVKTNW